MRVELGAIFLLIACSDNATSGNDTGGRGGTSGASPGVGGSTGTAGSKGGTTSAGGMTSAGGGTGGGASGTAGTAGSTGGSGTMVRGALSLNLLAPDGCAFPEQYQDFPKMASGHPVTATQKDGGVADGEVIDEYPAKVHCQWSGAASPYTFSGSFDLQSVGVRRTVSLSSTIAEGQADDGNLLLDSDELPAQYLGSCSFTPIELDVATHSVWVSFSCDAFKDPDGNSCAVGPSYYYFENCTAP